MPADVEVSGGRRVSRRRVLQGAAVAAGGIWVAPVVESVAHSAAASSAASTNGIASVVVAFSGSAGGFFYLAYDVPSGVCSLPPSTVCGFSTAPVGPQGACLDVGATLTSDSTGVTLCLPLNSSYTLLDGFERAVPADASMDCNPGTAEVNGNGQECVFFSAL
ncbi:MAG: hypothetical protein ACRDZQ_05060 [Acidimicrobiales bacterium]